MSNLKAQLYTTDASNSQVGSGSFTLTQSGSSYSAKVDLTVSGQPVTGEVEGQAVDNQGGLAIISLSGGNLKFTLVQNPYESKVSYGGCAANGGLIYNMTLVAG